MLSWNIAVSNITSSSARVWWSNFPLPLSVSYYLVRYKEVFNGTNRLFHVSRSSSAHYMKLLKGFTKYEVQVFAVTEGIGNVTYASREVSLRTAEGGKSVISQKFTLFVQAYPISRFKAIPQYCIAHS